MQWIDWAILIIILISAGISLLRGFVKEALSLVAWIGAFFVAKAFYKDFAPMLQEFISTPSLQYATAWIIIFLITVVTLSMVNFLFARFVEKAGLGGMDRMMGMIFGVFRGVLVAALLIIGLKAFSHVEEDDWWVESQLIEHVEVVGSWFYDYVKDSLPQMEIRFPDKSVSQQIDN